jgi:hypothetical protein
MGAGLGNSTALITDGRFSGASRGFIIGKFILPVFGEVRSIFVQVTLSQKLGLEDR